MNSIVPPPVGSTHPPGESADPGETPPVVPGKAAYYGDGARRPERVPIVWENIPHELRTLPRWVAWRFEWRKDQWAKIPCSLKHVGNDLWEGRAGFGHARTNDPSTWAEWERAVEKVQTNQFGDLDGIGFVFNGDGLFGGDIDGCRNPETGELTAFAAGMLRDFATYAEVSPSGRGVKFIGRSKFPEGMKGRRVKIEGGQELEVYDRTRYFTLTGRRVDGIPDHIAECQPALDRVIAEHFPPEVPTTAAPTATRVAAADVPDAELYDWLGRTASGARLWVGDTSEHGGDDSAADLALCNLLAYRLGPDANLIDYHFRRSGLMRPKWDELRGRESYGAITIGRSLAGRTKFYDPGRRVTSTAPSAAAANTDPARRLPRGALDKVDGDEPDNPHRLAAEWLRCGFRGRPAWFRFWRDEFYLWGGSAYEKQADADVQAKFNTFIRQRLKQAHEYAVAEFEKEKKDGENQKPPTTRPVTASLVTNAMHALKGFCVVPADTDAPTWLDGATGPDPKNIIAAPNGLLDLEPATDPHTRAAALLTPDPDYFTTNAVGFPIDLTAPRPVVWLEFLSQLWPGDQQSIELLQQWFGYCLTSDTSRQKMLWLIGPSRAGKGVINDVLTNLVGAGNVHTPSFQDFATEFGLWPLLGKSVAIVGEGRLAAKGAEAVAITARLLQITGEDPCGVNRKGKPYLCTRLGCRLVVAANELPRLIDNAGALLNRSLVLRLTRSFAGREDETLKHRLRAELPGILMWAIEGLARLRKTGRFVQPDSGKELKDELAAMLSPLSAFVKERCVLGPGEEVEKEALYLAWKEYCEAEGREKPGTQTAFKSSIRAKYPEIMNTRPRAGGRRVQMFAGIRLRRASDPDPDETDPDRNPDRTLTGFMETAAHPHPSGAGQDGGQGLVRDTAPTQTLTGQHSVRTGQGGQGSGLHHDLTIDEEVYGAHVTEGVASNPDHPDHDPDDPIPW